MNSASPLLNMDRLRNMSRDERYGTLGNNETRWMNRQQFLESQGYMLRPRYRPDWSPSWRRTGVAVREAEDSIILWARHNVIDATRIADGKLVYIKQVKTGDEEIRIASTLSSEPLCKDPRNHCVPIFDVLQDPNDKAMSYLVMPFLRYIDDPNFEIVENILDCGEQILEGLVFLHEQGVAHRDCSYKNIMMDASTLFPRGHHPVKDMRLPDFSDWAPVLSRVDTPVKYYFTDFGISTWFSPEASPKLVLGEDGLDDEVPELSDTVPYDPFKVDIFIVGNMFKKQFVDTFSNVNFLNRIVRKMVQREPSSRPDAAEALRDWQAMRRSILAVRRHWRVRPRAESLYETMVFDSVCFYKLVSSVPHPWINWLVFGIVLYIFTRLLRLAF